MILHQSHLGFQPMQGLQSAVGKADIVRGRAKLPFSPAVWACSQDDLECPRTSRRLQQPSLAAGSFRVCLSWSLKFFFAGKLNPSRSKSKVRFWRSTLLREILGCYVSWFQEWLGKMMKFVWVAKNACGPALVFDLSVHGCIGQGSP